MPRTSTEAIVIHCTATLAHQAHTVASIRAMHMVPKSKGGQGFSDIGYHYLLCLDGKTYQGRKPEDSIGAHVGTQRLPGKSFNLFTLGYSYVGGLRSLDAKPTDTRNPAQMKEMEAHCRKLLATYPNAVILGHRDLSPDLDQDGIVEPPEYMKQCPCFDAGLWAKALGLPGGAYSHGKFVGI